MIFKVFSKRCFLNCVFQNGVFRGWSGSVGAKGTKMLAKTGVFRHSSSLWRGLPLSQAEVRNLKNTVWKSPLRNPQVIFGKGYRNFTA